MKFFKLFPYYISWHYTGGVIGLGRVWDNYLWFITEYFSISVLTKSFFKPYIKLKDDIYVEYESGVVSFVMSIVGVILRSIVILAGVIAYVVFLLSFFLAFIIWLLLPFIIATFLIFGLVTILR